MRSSVKRLAIAGVLGLAVFATVAEGSSSGDSQSGSSNEAPASEQAASGSDSEESAAPAEPEIGLNEEARDGKFAFTVTKVKCGAKKVGTEFLNEKAQGQFCLVTMTVKNIGDEAQLFDAGSQKGLTSTGATVDADGTASLYANEDSNSFLEEINPGNAIENVVVVYDIAKDQDLVALELHDSMFSDGVLVATK